MKIRRKILRRGKKRRYNENKEKKEAKEEKAAKY